MIYEDDAEVILEGGELYKYLKSQGATLKDEYYSSKEAAEPILSTERISKSNSNAVPDDVVSIVNMILNSDCLLEEDASYLFKRFSDLVPESQMRIPYKFFLPGMVLGISAYGYWKFNLWKLCPTVMTCSTVYLFYEMSTLLKHLKQKEKIKQILLDLKSITAYIRKNIKLVQEEDSLIYSKEKVQELRKDVNTINEHTLSRKKFEIFIICQKLIHNLKALIVLSRNITLEILKRQGQKSLDCNVSYIALYSDEQLGLSKYGEEVDEETNVLPFIDILRNVYLIIQSETLREFGLHLCGFTEIGEILTLTNLLNQYRFKSKKILFALKKMYDKHFYPTYIPKKVKSENKSVRYLGNIVNSISSSLNSLLIDSRKLENFIDESSDEIEVETSRNIGLKLLKMEREAAYLVEHIHISAQQFLKQTNYFNQNMCHIFPKCNEKVIKTECMVGTSDFSISGHDEVYLGLVEGTESIQNDNDYIGEYRKPAELGILIDELKSALITKREEFEKREIKALKSLEDIENYKSCAADSSKISDQSKTEKKSKMDHCASTSKNEFSEEIRNVIPLDKDLAIKASDFFKSWNKTVTDECFGDEIDDDDDEDL